MPNQARAERLGNSLGDGYLSQRPAELLYGERESCHVTRHFGDRWGSLPGAAHKFMHDSLFFYRRGQVTMHVSDLQSTLGQSWSKAIDDLKQLIAIVLSSSKLGLIKDHVKSLLANQKSMFLVGSSECMKSCNMKPRSEHISRGWQVQFFALIPVPPFVHNDGSCGIHRGVSSLSRK